MKSKLLVAGLILLIGAAVAEAKPRPVKESTGTYVVTMPGPRTFSSNAVYYTSTGTTASNLSTVVKSSASTLLYAIHVASGGSNNSTFQVYDASVATSAAAAVSPIYSAYEQKQWTFEVGLTSGLAVDVQGAFPPKLTYIYAQW